MNVTLVLLLIVNVSRLPKNCHFLPKLPIPQNPFLQAYFLILQKLKNMSQVVLVEEPKTGLCFEIRQRQQKYWRKPKLQSLANPAVTDRDPHIILARKIDQGGRSLFTTSPTAA